MSAKYGVWIMMAMVSLGCFAAKSSESITPMSQTIAAGDDFYQYVNHKALKQATIPEGYASLSSFVRVHLKTQQQLSTILTSILTKKDSDLNADEKNIRNLYLSYMNAQKIEDLGLTPINAELTLINEAQSHLDVARIMAKPGHVSIFETAIDIDQKDPEHYRLMLGQGGLGLGSKRYYLDTSLDMVHIRQQYLQYISFIFEQLGYENHQEKAESVLNFEAQLAKQYWSSEELRDVLKMYTPMSLSQLQSFAPGFYWSAYFSTSSIPPMALNKIILVTDTAITAAAKVFADTDVDTLKAYLLFHYTNGYADFLPQIIADAHFDFFSRELNGIHAKLPRQDRSIRAVDSLFGEAMGKLYVKHYFSAQSKQQITELIDYIKDTFAIRFRQNQWMDKATKQHALNKLAQFRIKIGYPDKWHDTQSLRFSEHKLIDNKKQIEQWRRHLAVTRLEIQVQHWEWDMNPQKVNAYYAPSSNEIVFPAAILQPPFFDPKADPAYNFGAIGAVIGHEIGHGFDDQGRHFDGQGVMRDWWSTTASQRYEQKTTALIKQYNQYSVNGVGVNGVLTLGENIGDLGGLTIALESYKRYALEHYPDGKMPVIDGLTGIQRFFIAWARVWQEKTTKAGMTSRLLTDPHSPGEFRVNGILRNIDDWYVAFDVTKDNALYLPKNQRVNIW